MASNWKFSVGSVLANDLNEMDISLEQLSKQTGFSVDYIYEVIIGKRRMTLDFAQTLVPTFGPPAEYWMSVQEDFDTREVPYVIDSVHLDESTGKFIIDFPKRRKIAKSGKQGKAL